MCYSPLDTQGPVRHVIVSPTSPGRVNKVQLQNQRFLKVTQKKIREKYRLWRNENKHLMTL